MATFMDDIKENEIGYICKVSGPRKFFTSLVFVLLF